MQRFYLSLAIGALFMGTSIGAASSQSSEDFPTKPIRLIVAASAGGGSDTVGRIVAEGLSQNLGQRVVVENVPGVGSVAGLTALSQADPDGYTIGTSNIAAIGINQHLMELAYEPKTDIIPIGMAMRTHRIVSVRADLPVNSVQELIQYMKDHPGELNYGSSGIGSSSHMGMELFMSLTGTEAVHVPYNNSAEVGAALAAGEVDVAIDSVTSHIPMADAGTLRFLATGCGQVDDIEQMKGLPPIQDAIPEMLCLTTWIGIFAPAGVPEPIVAKLNKAMNDFLSSPEGIERSKTAGWDPDPSTPEELKEIWFTETDVWEKVIKDANITAQ
jgi:tripartite-type tricarboxylate transporter receptor subunit TctC